MNHFKFPLLNAFKMVPSTSTPGVHFDDRWFEEQIKTFETKTFYHQKWVKADTTILQMESSIAPDSLKLYNLAGAVVKSFNWTAVFTTTAYSIYETTFDVNDVPVGIYFLYQRVNLLSVDWKAVSEPINIKTSWPNTLLFRYYNSYNRDDVAWSTNIEMQFRCEAGIMDYNPEAEISDYIDQVQDREILDGVPSRSFKLYIGEAPGVAPWVIDILNRIFCLDHVYIEEMQYCRAGKWEVNRVRNFPKVGGSLDIVPSQNLQSLEFADTDPLEPGIITAYNIETGFFGPGTVVPITEVEENG